MSATTEVRRIRSPLFYRLHRYGLEAVCLAIGFFLAGIAWSALLAYGIAGSRRLLGPTLVRAFSALSGLLFLYFAARIFLEGLRDLHIVAG